MPELILASASPRRQELLKRLGFRFTVAAADVDEHTDAGAMEAVQALSRRKALAAAELHPGCVILAADTLVAVDNVPLGKPADAADAHRMLRLLAGREHHVYTGVCCVSAAGDVYAGLDASEVRFGEMSDAEIDAYIATGEPMDKAGAYALQGGAAAWIEEVRGTPSGIIGLPLPLTRRLLQQCGLRAFPNAYQS